MGVRSATINSTNADEWAAIEASLAAGEIDLLAVSPERLNAAGFARRVLPGLARGLGLLVVDEAHCISDWGHDFRADYRRIRDAIANLAPGTPVLATTAPPTPGPTRPTRRPKEPRHSRRRSGPTGSRRSSPPAALGMGAGSAKPGNCRSTRRSCGPDPAGPRPNWPTRSTAARTSAAFVVKIDAVPGGSLPPGPVLLVDDTYDSGWTITVVAHRLREADAGPVLPFVLTRRS